MGEAAITPTSGGRGSDRGGRHQASAACHSRHSSTINSSINTCHSAARKNLASLNYGSVLSSVPFRVHLSPLMVHLNPLRVHLNPLRVHLSPLRVHLNPLRVHLNPLRVHLSPLRVHLSPLRVHLNPLMVHLALSNAKLSYWLLLSLSLTPFMNVTMDSIKKESSYPI
ncbi:hypothetical protein FHG87_005573 [Trinorchestia longiramus]|nr:hypothetical protein FHG87_005573 [Trinorchestia longiramus]